MAVQLIRHRFTVADYHRMVEAGILTEDDRVELIEGEIVQMSPIGSRHAACVKRLIRLLDRGVGDRAIVGAQDPIRLGENSEPQPDLALLRPRADFYAAGHPGPEDVLLVVEVAEASAEYDRKVKVPLYARYGVPEAWLVDLEARCLEIYLAPRPDGYSQSCILRPSEQVAPQAFPDLALAVGDILG